MGHPGTEVRAAMRVAHIKNVANYAWRLAQAQKRLGHDAVVYSYGDPYGFPADVFLSGTDPLRENLQLLKRFRELKKFDVIHLHGGLWRSQVFWPVFRKLADKRIAIHYHGSELRRAVGGFHQNAANVHFYTPGDLARLVPHGSVWLPQAIDLASIRGGIKQMSCLRPIFAHFTTSEANKGTKKVIEMFAEAFGPLKKLSSNRTIRYDSYQARDATLWVLDKIPYNRVQGIMEQADVVFDQIAPWGIYGYTSVEGMALGKPVLATVDRRLYPSDCPVIFPDEQRLVELADDAARRRHYGTLGRAYVERVHESSVVAKKALAAYDANL